MVLIVAPITAPEAERLLRMDDAHLAESLYEQLGVRNRSPAVGLPRGPYFDPVDVPRIRQAIREALGQAEG